MLKARVLRMIPYLVRILAGGPLVLVGLATCGVFGPSLPSEDLIDQDYYFVRGGVQIQGEAPLPPARENVSTKDPVGNTKTESRFLTLEERRQICRQRAIIDARARWLALSEREWENQAEWTLRLNMGARGRWSGCLDGAFERGVFYDRPNRCRVSLLFPCSPRDY